MANTTWNNSDKSSNVTLSGTPLVVCTQTGTGLLGGVRAVDRQITGKFYWEETFTTAPGINTTVGLGTIAGPNNVPPDQGSATSGPWTLGISSQLSGVVSRNGATVISGVGAFSGAGTLIGIAIDLTLTNPQAWFRVGAAGNWNGNAAYSPSGAGGIPLWGPGFPIYPMCWTGGQNDVITANFGDSAFSGAVPSGYTSGFTAGASPAVNEIVPQIGVAVWTGNASPDMRLTQAGIEVWATPTGGSTQAVLTQIGAEVWGSVATASAQHQPVICIIN